MGSLSRLDLSGNNLNGSDSPGFIRPIASALKTNTSITELSLSKNELNAEAAGILSEGIRDSGSLASLDISDNNIGDAQEAKIKQICAGKSIKCTL
jgi:Ran GTPase-activating protein (RanGAP) involved in mRNA processing and transport